MRLSLFRRDARYKRGMNRTDFRKLLHYSDNCWRLLGETLAAAPNAWDAPFETTSRWNTIRLLLAHCIAAEERITLRLQDLPLPGPYEERAAPGREELYRDHQTMRAATYAYLDSLTDAEIADETPVIPATPDRGGMTREDALFQILNHENYHRGQVVMLLQRLGGDPPNFDYILLKDTIPE